MQRRTRSASSQARETRFGARRPVLSSMEQERPLLIAQEVLDLLHRDRAFAHEAPAPVVVSQIDDRRWNFAQALATIDDDWHAVGELVLHLGSGGALGVSAEVCGSRGYRNAGGANDGERNLVLW